jgi:hypothetical protein
MQGMADAAETEETEVLVKMQATVARYLVALTGARAILPNPLLPCSSVSTPVPGETAAPEAPVGQEVEEPVDLRGAFTA